MARKFSAASAAVSGWALVGRRPLAVGAWSAVILLGLFLPAVLLCLPLLDLFVEMIRTMPQTPNPQDEEVMARMMALQSHMSLVNIGMMIVQVVAPTIVMAAAFRAVLRPDEGRGFFLRVGAAEGWMMLVSLILSFGGNIAAVAAMLPGALLGLIGFVVMAIGGDKDTGAVVGLVVGVLGVIVGELALLWALLRLSMALPMTFAERRFMLFESWALTKGQSLRLLGMLLLIGLTLLVLQIVVAAVVLGVAAVIGPDLARTLPSARSVGDVLRLTWPVLTAAAPLAAIVQTVVLVVCVTPLASVYRALTTAREAEADA
ncbi:hypothetical protein [Caulobacter endophyticus]|uniref:hypothetical protein n=1 Tax=Caulobacter endophyticus TaxID=2172652 RepID=UPI0011B25DB9|nr:hypothetical protein [Caulobacter endophyticus]